MLIVEYLQCVLLTLDHMSASSSDSGSSSSEDDAPSDVRQRSAPAAAPTAPSMPSASNIFSLSKRTFLCGRSCLMFKLLLRVLVQKCVYSRQRITPRSDHFYWIYLYGRIFASTVADVVGCTCTYNLHKCNVCAAHTQSQCAHVESNLNTYSMSIRTKTKMPRRYSIFIFIPYGQCSYMYVYFFYIKVLKYAAQLHRSTWPFERRTITILCYSPHDFLPYM